MADTPQPPAELPLAANGEVKAYDRLGNKITVPKERVGELYAMGGRVARKQEVAEATAEENYAKQSTAMKVATTASMIGPLTYPLHAYLRSQGGQVAPELESYTQGVSEGMTGGIASVGMKEVVGAIGGDQAARNYGQTVQTAAEGSPTAKGLGVAAGFVGGAVAGGPKAGLGKAANIIPGAAISNVGGAVERAVASRLANVAGGGVISRALATSAELGARGAIEGALYSATEKYSEAQLGDHQLAADKLFAAVGMGALGGAVGGGVLGFGGSLAASGVRKGTQAVGGAISRAMQKGEAAVAQATAKAEQVAADAQAAAQQAVGDAQAAVTTAGAKAKAVAETTARQAVADAQASAKAIAEVTGTSAAQEASAFEQLIAKASDPVAQKAFAYEQAWKAIGAGHGLQSTSYAKKAQKYLPNGTQDVGEVLMRKGVINAEDGIVNAMRSGTPDQMLPKIEAARAAVGQEIGKLTAASPAMVDAMAIAKAINNVAAPYEASAATRPLARNLRAYAAELYDSLGLGSRTSVPLDDLLRERRALSSMVFEGPVDARLAVEVKRNLSSELEDLVTKSLDDASGKMPGELAAQYKALKRDYQALILAEGAAEDSAARMAKGATFGLRDMLAGASGGITGAVTTAGHKVIRERGNAAAAVLVHRMADLGTITKAVQAVDQAIGKASKGLLSAPKPGKPVEVPDGNVRQRAERGMRQIAAWQADPAAFAENVAKRTETMQATTPQLASALAQRFTSGLAFLASKVPVKPDVDPFDPHKAPRLSDAEAHTLAQYMWYWEKPERVFEEASRGKLTYEGVETLKAMPGGLFQQLQQQVAADMADLVARGVAPPYRQRELVGALLDFPAVPSQRPEHMQLLQSCVQVPEAEQNTPGASQNRPMPNKTQPSTLDRIESR